MNHPDTFVSRHIGPTPEEQGRMLAAIGVADMDQLIAETVPADIRLEKPLRLDEPLSEHQLLSRLRAIGRENRLFKSYIGLGYYDCITPSVIVRNVLENPGWYTPYTPYQAEVSQGRLESLLNFQTMIMELTAMDVANASLLDEATAAAEAMALIHRAQERRLRKGGPHRFAVSATCFPQTLELLRTRAEPVGIELLVGDLNTMSFDESVFGVLAQTPDAQGALADWSAVIERAHAAGALVAVATDLLSLALATPPGEWGADVVFGSAQRFGVPLGYGGPHAAFFATREKYKREMPGRIIGVSRDAQGNRAYRMSIQTREQHIRREKATSNICTAQALLANIAAMYGIYHGPEGLRKIATRVHAHARILDRELTRLGYHEVNEYYFDTIQIEAGADRVETIRAAALEAGINFRYIDDRRIGIALDETTSLPDVENVVRLFAAAAGRGDAPVDLSADETQLPWPDALIRDSSYLAHPVFNAHHSETAMMRYIRRIEKKDLGLDTAMIPLGSCTMKLNAATEMLPITWPEFAGLHPFVPVDQAGGYARIFRELESDLCEITGFAAVSLQPNAGSQGEYAGLLVIRAYHAGRGEPQRNVVLIPASAHGTNPASAAMAGMKVVVVACDESGYVDIASLNEKAAQYRDTLAALMVTYPSTYGIFEENIRAVCAIVHEHGGQVYMDGANLNAQTGLTSPARVGADVCHLNLHKTFAIPHGGGGPGMGPIAVAEHLAPYLPGHPLVKVGGEQAISAVSAAPWGSASILLISYACIRMLGAGGLTRSAKVAILSANYIKARLESHYDVHYTGAKGRVAHELIFDLRPLKEKSGIDEQDVAKRLMDYGFHAPTVSWPVPGTMMIEPTESEPLESLDRFCDAMIAIRAEIQAVINGEADRQDNVLKNAPHTAEEMAGDEWRHAYTREQATYPLPYVRMAKFWPAVARVDNTYGDRHLVCSCPPLSAYSESPALEEVNSKR